jgi:hypothetical protein
MRENPLGGKTGHGHPEVYARTDRDDVVAKLKSASPTEKPLPKPVEAEGPGCSATMEL